MPRPTVLIATTNAEMAYALQALLKEKCRSLGLKLVFFPEGNESDAGVAKARAYDSAEALFDVLEKRDPMGLADTLVVLDVGTELVGAFKTKAPKDDSWHVTNNRAGVAAELLMRFPQVFPVFLSPAVPIPESGKWNEEWVISPKDGEAVCGKAALEAGNWSEFFMLQTCLATRHMPGLLHKPGLLDSLPALSLPLHFVSPLDGAMGLYSVLHRFARGMRCWFDPTGLRTLVKNCFLGTLFGNNNGKNWTNTMVSREVLLDRLDQAAVAIDEEREFATLNAYSSYKFGRRAWIVTTFGEFNDKPLWTAPAENLDVVVLRDIDLRFPDVPDSETPRGDNYVSLRQQLESVDSEKWKAIINQSNWSVRVVSSRDGIVSETNADDWNNVQKRIGEKSDHRNGKYIGLPKPIGSLYELKELLFKVGDPAESIASKLLVPNNPQDAGEHGGHGAPYLNLAMAESLLLQSKRCKDGPVENLVGALLAGEAYELLLCMSKTTALEALLLQHKKEVAAEVEFPGVAHAIDIGSRRDDIEETLNKVTEKQPSASMRNMFLSQYWSELRTVFKNGEQFQAAEQANKESLVHSVWMPKSANQIMGKFWHPGVKWNKFVIQIKNAILGPAISFWWWLAYAGIGSVVLAFSYLAFNYEPGKCTLRIGEMGAKLSIQYIATVWHQVVLSTFNSNPAKGFLNFDACLEGAKDTDRWFYLLTIGHFAFAYVMLGLLITMTFRKVTRA